MARVKIRDRKQQFEISD